MKVYNYICKINIFKRNNESEFGVGIALIILFCSLSFLSPFFLSSRNMINILYQVSAIGILAVGQTMVIVSGGIDLSIGAIFEMSGWLMCYTISKIGLVEGLFVGLTIAIVCGLVNGIIIAYAKLEPFIVTLGTMSIIHGLVYIISDAKTVSNLPNVLERIDDFKFFGIPSYVLLFILVFVLGHLFLIYTKPGRMIFAIGSNETAALYSGVRVQLFKVIPYVISGITAFVAVFVQSMHLMAMSPDAGANLNLDSIAAVVIGGASLAGGKGTTIGTLMGVLLMGLLRNGLNLLGVSTYWQSVAVGMIIIVAVAIEKIMRTKSK